MVQIEQIAPVVTRRLRQQVLYPTSDIEQVILPEDDQGYHFGLYTNNKLIGVVSLFMTSQVRLAQFRKFAIDPAYQGKGFGTALLAYILDFAKRENVYQIWCNARIQAKSFYLRNGFRELGDIFEKNGILYVKMIKKLSD